MRGAVTPSEIVNRYGDYFYVIWKGKRANGPADIEFAYRKTNTQSKVFKKNIKVNKVKRRNVTKITVIGKELIDELDQFVSKDNEATNKSKGFDDSIGVLSWRVTIKQGGEVIGQERSYLWKD